MFGNCGANYWNSRIICTESFGRCQYKKSELLQNFYLKEVVSPRKNLSEFQWLHADQKVRYSLFNHSKLHCFCACYIQARKHRGDASPTRPKKVLTWHLISLENLAKNIFALHITR